MNSIIHKLLVSVLCLSFSSCFLVLGDGDLQIGGSKERLTPGYDTQNMFLHEIQLEINRVRTNPSFYASEILEPRLSRYTGFLYRNDEGKLIRTEEGKETMKECIDALKRADFLDVLEMEKGLHLAAQYLANDQAISGKKGHIASDGSDIQTRMARYGTPIGLLNEICKYGSENPRDVVISLLVDDNIKSRKNRKLILNANFRKIGIGFSSKHIAPEGAATIIELAETYLSY
ncbi:MAG: CAP domain-containing protein [Treponema sp.]